MGNVVAVSGTAPVWPDGSVHGEVFGGVQPTSTMVVVAGLLDPRWRVEVEMDAVLGS